MCTYCFLSTATHLLFDQLFTPRQFAIEEPDIFVRSELPSRRSSTHSPFPPCRMTLSAARPRRVEYARCPLQRPSTSHHFLQDPSAALILLRTRCLHVKTYVPQRVAACLTAISRHITGFFNDMRNASGVIRCSLVNAKSATADSFTDITVYMRIIVQAKRTVYLSFPLQRHQRMTKIRR